MTAIDEPIAKNLLVSQRRPTVTDFHGKAESRNCSDVVRIKQKKIWKSSVGFRRIPKEAAKIPSRSNGTLKPMFEVDRTKPYECPIGVEQSDALLKVRGKMRPVKVVSYSRETFTVEVSQRTLKSFRNGASTKFQYSGENWDVRISGKTLDHSGRPTLRLERLSENSPIKVPGSVLSSLFGNKGTDLSDPVVPVYLTIMLIIALLVLPGWGEELGTSDLIISFVRAGIESFQSVFS